MELFAYCLLPSHIHLIFRDKNNDPGKLIKELKTYTSKEMKRTISKNPQESRKEWILWMMERAGKKTAM